MARPSAWPPVGAPRRQGRPGAGFAVLRGWSRRRARARVGQSRRGAARGAAGETRAVPGGRGDLYISWGVWGADVRLVGRPIGAPRPVFVVARGWARGRSFRPSRSGPARGVIAGDHPPTRFYRSVRGCGSSCRLAVWGGWARPLSSSGVSWFGWRPFLRPGLTSPRRRAEPRSRMARPFGGHRALCAAHSVLDGGEHGARLDQVGRPCGGAAISRSAGVIAGAQQVGPRSRQAAESLIFRSPLGATHRLRSDGPRRTAGTGCAGMGRVFAEFRPKVFQRQLRARFGRPAKAVHLLKADLNTRNVPPTVTGGNHTYAADRS